MSKQALSAAIREKAGIESQARAERIYDAILGSIQEALSKGDTVTLREFGTFSVKTRAARKGRNPQTGAEMEIPASRSVRFVPGMHLKNAAQAMHRGESQDWLDYRNMRRSVSNQMDELKKKLNTYVDKVDSLGTEAKNVYSEQVDKLNNKYDDMRSKFQDATRTGGEAWRELLSGLEKAGNELSEAFKRAWDKF